MKIKYEDLITDANRRKDSLKKLEEVLAEVPHMTVLAHDLQAFALRYKNAVNKLDHDTRKILPAGLDKAMENSLVHRADNIWDENYLPPGGMPPVRRGLLQLSDYLEREE